MTLGFMQPYFLPYLGYFDLIRQTDQWVYFDTAQNIRRQGSGRGWVNRNRISKVGGGWTYLTVPVRHAPLQTPINRISPDDTQKWVARVLAQFDALRRRAPYHEAVREFLAPALSAGSKSIAELNIRLVDACCAYLGIPIRARTLSSLGLDLGPIDAPGDWALHLCKALGADGYLNPPGGRDLYDVEQFASAGVMLAIQEFVPMRYPVADGFSYTENLSIIDVLAWNSPESVFDHLERQTRYFPARR